MARREAKKPEAPAATAADLIDAANVVRERARAAKSARLEAEVKALSRELELAEERFGVLCELDTHRRPTRPLTTPIKGHGKGSRRTATAVVLASDWHVEERIDPKTIDGLNEYNPQIAEIRSVRFFEGTEWLIREQQRLFQVRDLFLWLGGDIITGYIHEELLEGNFLSPTEAVLFAAKLIGNGIRFLLKVTELNINVGCDFGNHGRTTLKPRVGTAAKNSYEWLMYHMLAKEFASEPRVQFRISDGHHAVHLLGGASRGDRHFRLHTTHGDKVKSMGGIGGIDVPLNRAIAQWHQTMPAECTAHGHFHQYQPGQRRASNGSLIGYSTFSRDICRAPYEPPQQTFFLVDSTRGKTQCAPIWVAE
jgi:hypothetical protein